MNEFEANVNCLHGSLKGPSVAVVCHDSISSACDKEYQRLQCQSQAHIHLSDTGDNPFTFIQRLGIDETNNEQYTTLCHDNATGNRI
jgi:hypothetical protein